MDAAQTRWIRFWLKLIKLDYIKLSVESISAYIRSAYITLDAVLSVE